MTVRGAILDLDDTLVDTSMLAQMRRDRDWKACVRNLSKTEIFDGISDLLAVFQRKGLKIGIVTTSVSFYASAVLKYHQIPHDLLIAFHDCSPRKPHPASILMCMEKLGCTSANTIAVGDALTDARAYVSADLPAFGAGWSSKFEDGTEWTAIFDHPLNLAEMA